MVNRIGLYHFVRHEWSRIMRVPVQTLVSPWVSALLYIFVFGQVVGKRIELIGGVEYIDFVLPGILTLNVIMASFSHSSSSIYFARFIRTIEEILTAPFSYLEILVGYVLGGLIRGLIVGGGIFMIAVLFGAANVTHLGLLLLYVAGISVIFSLLGLIVGLWANGFEQLGVLTTFVLTPLTFLGGAFYSVTMLPPAFQTFTRFNPIFYLIDGIRYSMVGLREANPLVGTLVILGLVIVLGAVVWTLFKRGWRLRE
jgi:ABC-2 type transport system permease protein